MTGITPDHADAAARAIVGMHPAAQVAAVVSGIAVVGIVLVLRYGRPKLAAPPAPHHGPAVEAASESLAELTRAVLALQRMVQATGECAADDVRDLRRTLDAMRRDHDQRFDRLTARVDAALTRVHERIDALD